MLKNKLKLMLLTTDNNSDLWELFVRQLIKNWPDFDLDIILNTENAINFMQLINNISNEYSVNIIFTNNFDKKVFWSERLKLNLRHFPSKYYLFILDDYILDGPVDTIKFKNSVDILEKNNDIAHINFLPSSIQYSYIYKGYKKILKNQPYRFNLQIGLWRRDFLLKFIREHETPWQFETWGNRRAKRYKNQVYHATQNYKIFDYKIGGIIKRGQWNGPTVIDDLTRWGFPHLEQNRQYFTKGDDKTNFNKRNFFKKIVDGIKSMI